MKQSSQIFNGGTSSFPGTNITTDEIQKCLEENKQLILAIMENQKVGKFNECAPHRAQLQQNLTFLSNLADTLSQAPAMPPAQMLLAQSIKQQGHSLQHPQAAVSQQQAVSSTRLPNQPSYDQQQQPQQLIQAQMGLQIGAVSNMLDMMGSNQEGLGANGGGTAANFLGKSVSGYYNNGGE